MTTNPDPGVHLTAEDERKIRVCLGACLLVDVFSREKEYLKKQVFEAIDVLNAAGDAAQARAKAATPPVTAPTADHIVGVSEMVSIPREVAKRLLSLRRMDRDDAEQRRRDEEQSLRLLPNPSTKDFAMLEAEQTSTDISALEAALAEAKAAPADGWSYDLSKAPKDQSNIDITTDDEQVCQVWYGYESHPDYEFFEDSCDVYPFHKVRAWRHRPAPAPVNAEESAQ